MMHHPPVRRFYMCTWLLVFLVLFLFLCRLWTILGIPYVMVRERAYNCAPKQSQRCAVEWRDASVNEYLLFSILRLFLLRLLL